MFIHKKGCQFFINLSVFEIRQVSNHFEKILNKLFDVGKRAKLYVKKMTDRLKTKQNSFICYMTVFVYFVLHNQFLKFGLVIPGHTVYYFCCIRLRRIGIPFPFQITKLQQKKQKHNGHTLLQCKITISKKKCGDSIQHWVLNLIHSSL